MGGKKWSFYTSFQIETMDFAPSFIQFSTNSFFKISDFNKIEDIFSFFEKYIRPSRLEGKGSLYFFKESVEPSVTHELNRDGKCIFAMYNSKCNNDNESNKLEALFLHILLSIYGQFYHIFNKVNGVIFESKENCTIISVWVKNNAEAINEVKKLFRKSKIFIAPINEELFTSINNYVNSAQKMI